MRTLLTLTASLIPSVAFFGGIYTHGDGVLLASAIAIAVLPIGFGISAIVNVDPNVVAKRYRHLRG